MRLGTCACGMWPSDDGGAIRSPSLDESAYSLGIRERRCGCGDSHNCRAVLSARCDYILRVAGLLVEVEYADFEAVAQDGCNVAKPEGRAEYSGVFMACLA